MIEIAATHVVLLLAVSVDPSTAIVSRAAAEALAAPFTEAPRVVLRALSAPPSTSELHALALEVKADSVIVFACTGEGCARADVRVTNNGSEPVARTVRFGTRDALGERGRAIGLLASTLLPEGWSRGGLPAAPVATAGPPGVTAIAATSATGPPVRTWSWGADATVAFLTESSGDTSDLALTVAAHRVLTGGWKLRVGVKLERGDLPGGVGTTRAAGGVAGVLWTSPNLDRPRRFGWGARADIVALGRQRRRNTQVDADDSRTDLALGGDAVGLVGFALSPRAAIIGDAGIEVLGSIGGPSGDDATLVANPPRFRLLAELGFLTRF